MVPVISTPRDLLLGFLKIKVIVTETADLLYSRISCFSLYEFDYSLIATEVMDEKIFSFMNEKLQKY